MAKNTKNAASTAISKAQMQSGTVNVKVDAAQWDATPGEVFGGNADILSLAVDEVAGPFVYEGVAEKKLELDGEKVDNHQGRDANGKLWRLPLSASFRRQIEESKLSEGDTFLLRRAQDAIKKKGKGKGNPMKIFQVKITARKSA